MPAQSEVGIVLREVTPEISQHMLTDLDKLPGVQLGDFLLQFELDEPRDSVKDIAREELRETQDIVKPAVEELKRLLEDDPDLHVPTDSEAWLVRFLRPCKFYPESSHELIKRYYGFKLKHHKHYDGLVPSKETNVFNQNVLTVLPTRDQHGRRVLVLELGKKWKHNKCSLDEVFKGCVLFLEAAMLEPETQICGAVVIFDMDGLSMHQVMQFTPPFAKRIVDWLQECIPLRVKGLYIINQPYIFNMVFTIFKPFLKEKLRSRIIFMGNDRDLLHKHISPKCLPDSYGGTLSIPNVTGAQWLELLLMCDQEFTEKWKHNKCSLDEVFKGCVLFLEAAMLEPETQICGAVVIFDMDGLSMHQVMQFTPPFAKRIVDWLQECIPLRVKGLYIINQPYIFNMVFTIFKPFLKEKLRSRIIFMGNDRDLLHKHISPKCLPDSYGGTLSIPNVTGAQWLELLLMCDQEFTAINSYGYKKK